MPESRASRVAAIDLGTNSVRLIVAEVEGADGYRVLDDERDQTRLGHRLDETGRIDPESARLTLDALRRMRMIAEGFGVDELRAVATAAVREASNGPEFVTAARDEAGVEIEVVSAEEEAELAMRSVRRHFPLGDGAAAIVDIGGGSMEVVFTVAGQIDEIHSMRVGAVRMTERFVHSDPISDEDWKALRTGIDREFDDQIGDPPFPTPVIIGSGGTFTTIGAMAMYDRTGEIGPVQGYELGIADFAHQLRRVREAALDRRRRMPGLSPERADIIVAGAAAIDRLAERLDAHRILVNDRGIRDGLILEMIARRTPTRTAEEDVTRVEAARAFARKCRSNVRHAEHVARLAVALFDELEEHLDVRAGDRELLEAAGILHDVGYLIRHRGHHLHAYHLIRHSALGGYSSYELELIANTARYHRRALPSKAHDNWTRVRPEDRKRVRALAGLLRLADGLDRTHSQAVSGVVLDDWREDAVRLRVLSEVDPWVEIRDAGVKSELLARVLGRGIELFSDVPAGAMVTDDG